MSVVDYDSKDNPIPLNTKVVLLFWAPWHEASVKNGPMDTVLTALAGASSSSTSVTNVSFGRVHAENNIEYTNQYNVTSVPTFVLVNENGTLFERIENCEDVAQITQSVQRFLTSPSTSSSIPAVETPVTGTTSAVVVGTPTTDEEVLKVRLERLINSAEVMVFMKGTPDTPRCGFSRQMIQLLNDENIPYGTFDILTDETVRQGLKQYSNWPTYPQIYVRGELIGGLDIVKEIKEEVGKLATEWNIMTTATISSSDNPDDQTKDTSSKKRQQTIEERCTELINQERIMLFMKGLPSAPKCGFSRTMVAILNEFDVPYGSFDILQDESVRQTLKQMQNWPTYPQLYVNGELIGGLDIVQELYDDGTLKDTLLP